MKKILNFIKGLIFDQPKPSINGIPMEYINAIEDLEAGYQDVTSVLKDTKEMNEDISEQIWEYVWDNADNEDTDEDLCQEHSDWWKKYKAGEYLKFIKCP